MDSMNIFCSEKKSVKTESELNFPCFVYDTPLLKNDKIYQSNYCGAIISKRYIHKPNYIRSSILIINIPQFTHWYSEWMIQLNKKIQMIGKDMQFEANRKFLGMIIHIDSRYLPRKMSLQISCMPIHCLRNYIVVYACTMYILVQNF